MATSTRGSKPIKNGKREKKMKKKCIYLASIDDMHINWFMFITIQGDTEHDRE